ncbi:hypothetical protein PGB90_003760 [Kerria lacca]
MFATNLTMFSVGAVFGSNIGTCGTGFCITDAIVSRTSPATSNVGNSSYRLRFCVSITWEKYLPFLPTAITGKSTSSMYKILPRGSYTCPTDFSMHVIGCGT